MSLKRAERDDFRGEAYKCEGGGRDVENVLVEVLDAGTGGGEWGSEGREEGEGVVVSCCKENGVEVCFYLVVCEADRSVELRGGEKLGYFRHVLFVGRGEGE